MKIGSQLCIEKNSFSYYFSQIYSLNMETVSWQMSSRTFRIQRQNGLICTIKKNTEHIMEQLFFAFHIAEWLAWKVLIIELCRPALFKPLSRPESIGWFIEDQDFSPSYHLAPSPPSSVSKLGRQHTRRLRKKDGRVGRRWGRSQSYDGEKSWSSGNRLIFSVVQTYCLPSHDDSAPAPIRSRAKLTS
jgi:hypothetical protein